MVRANGFEPKFGKLIPEFERCVREAMPKWFLMEEVPDAPIPEVERYGVHHFLLNNRQLGEEQNRTRRISFGVRNQRVPLQVETVALNGSRFRYAATGGGEGGVPVAISGSGKPKRRNKIGRIATKDILSAGTQRSGKGFAAVKDLQGLPADFDLPGWTIEAKVTAVANGVPLAMGRARGGNGRTNRNRCQSRVALIVRASDEPEEGEVVCRATDADAPPVRTIKDF
jgi:DNA (cytosine-5)-methyltransferase 1